MHFELKPHTPREDDLAIIVDIRGRQEFCFVEFALRGDQENCDLPEQKDEPIREESLENISRFELIAAEQDTPAYTAFTFALDGSWNCNRYSDFREDMTPVEIETPDIVIFPAKVIYRVSAMIPWNLLDNHLCGISAVLKHSDGSESIWTLPQTGESSDSHDRNNFVGEFKGESFVIPDNADQKRFSGISNAMKNGPQGPGCPIR